MKSGTWCFAAIALITLSVIAISLVAQDNKAAPPRYVLKDLGNLRGKNAYLFTGPPSFRLLDQRGTVVDAAGTAISRILTGISSQTARSTMQSGGGMVS